VTAVIAEPATREEPGWRLLAIVLAVLLAVRVVALAANGTDLFFDEAQYWTWSLEPAFGYYSKPPLIAWLISASTAVCGSSEFCIRLPSPILHTLGALGVYALGSRAYGPVTGFWSAVVFATLPGISFSAALISTDVPLLACWALALWALVALIDTRTTRAWWPAIALGLAFGLGLNAKYAMAYFIMCLGVYVAVTPDRRELLGDVRLWVGLALSVLLILPNLVWNASNSFATFAHTADNANWKGPLFNPGRALEFLGSQFGVFGPILFGALLVLFWRARRARPEGADRLMLAFCVPILAVVTLQAFLSRALANWAAPAYVSATVLVTAVWVREASWGWLRLSTAIHLGILVLLAFAFAAAGRIGPPVGADPFARTLGWHEVATLTRDTLANARSKGAPFASVITDERALTAELLYYMRNEPTPVLAWTGGGRPQDHYEMLRPFGAGSAEPVLLVALRNDTQKILDRFASVTPLGVHELPAGPVGRRQVALYRLTGFKAF
jgi:4-amino-4-deoxy-L-arabinose transferase-like glycosyltransferase